MDSDGTKDLKIRHVAFMRAQIGSFRRCVTLLCVFTHACPPDDRPPPVKTDLLPTSGAYLPSRLISCMQVYAPAEALCGGSDASPRRTEGC